MTATIDRPPSAATRRPLWLYAGLALTLVATAAPLLDLATTGLLAQHVRDAYPHWSAHDVALDRNAIAIYLAVTSALGVPLWLLTIRAVRRGKRWGLVVGAIAFAAGVLIALTNLSVGGEHYQVIVPYLFGTLTLLPCIAGIVGLVQAWRYRSTARG
ncbi:hypothetical protein Athai_44990 [Actinocatenispora thailandica]|uniref:Uncharacterized protein n=1 Tax=Actinocatenispora thailandica TaxID=227318 RepID=A0A7R7HYX3_9ACTN|nr:hypothetical protein [Actinocatenispora thailandica]BCJ36996.1 hypothetical protein Athai_44990 [Actinocatenispora thailandica]